VIFCWLVGVKFDPTHNGRLMDGLPVYLHFWYVDKDLNLNVCYLDTDDQDGFFRHHDGGFKV
jgi:hypothetical protein